ncbi:hypothetical protein V6N13_028111 [Hibiscus sabdariffa]|uniref:Uncharacterized protein n=1 Tax=Hibiscus sabdariffa TaxID=183260 RepID=A0ABR1ZZ78_9ROSI
MPLSIPLFISDETSSECHSENSVNEQLYHPRVMGTSVSIAVVASSSSIKFFSWSPQFYDGVGIACLLNTTLVLPKFEVIAY